MKQLLPIALILSILTACTPVTARRGNMLEDYQVAEIKPGISTRSDVLRILGSPTTQSTFNEDIWYYLGQDTQKTGIFDPKVTGERTVTVTFNKEGIVSKIGDSGGHWQDIPYAREKTPTHGNDLTFTQQLLGNLGRFNKPTEEKKQRGND